MVQNRLLTAVLSPTAKLLNKWGYKRPFAQLQKTIILQPGTVADVMMATPMVALLKRTFPKMRLDWAVREQAYGAIVGNKNVTKPRIIPTFGKSHEVDQEKLVQQLRQAGYDSCFIPDYYPQMAQAAIKAQIPQRVGFWHRGFGYNLTFPIQPPPALRHQASLNLVLAELGSSSIQLSRAPMVFYPSDGDREFVSECLVDELAWFGERPLIILNPGSEDEDDTQRWPIEKYVLLGNRILRHHDPQLIIIGQSSDKKVAQEVAGMIAGKVPNWAGKLTFGQIGALAEVSNLYIGNDVGSTHIAAAMGCTTLAIFGPSDPSVSAPYHADEARVAVLRRSVDDERPFSWEDGVTVAEAETAVRKLLA